MEIQTFSLKNKMNSNVVRKLSAILSQPLCSHNHQKMKHSKTMCIFHGIILSMRSANERRRYIVTSSLIGWAHTQMRPIYHGISSVFTRHGYIYILYAVHRRLSTWYWLASWINDYRKISNIRHTKSQNLNDSRLVLQSFLPNLLKPGVK